MELMNLKQACEYLGISLVTLRKLIKEGRITAVADELDGRQKLIRKDELDAILARRGGLPANGGHDRGEQLAA